MVDLQRAQLEAFRPSFFQNAANFSPGTEQDQRALWEEKKSSARHLLQGSEAIDRIINYRLNVVTGRAQE